MKPFLLCSILVWMNAVAVFAADQPPISRNRRKINKLFRQSHDGFSSIVRSRRRSNFSQTLQSRFGIWLYSPGLCRVRREYTGLKTLLTAEGKNLTVHGVSPIYLGIVRGGYSWHLKNHFDIRAALGVAKVLDMNLSLSSSSSTFDNSNLGKNSYANSIASIKSTLASYGITPTIETSLVYEF